MQFLKKHKLLLIVSSISFLIGIYIGIAWKDYQYLRLDNSIDLAEALNIIISFLTLIVAFYIAIILDRKKRKEEYEFDYIYTKLKEIKALSAEIIKTITANNCEISVVNSKFKSLSISYLDLKETLELCDYEIPNEKDREILKLNQYIRGLATESRKMVYGKNIIAYQAEEELTINKGVIIYSEIRIDEIRNYLLKYNNVLFRSAVR